MGGCGAERQGLVSFINQQVMQRMSRTAISNAVVASKDVIFLAGAEAKAAYFTQHLASTNRWLHAFQCRICWTPSAIAFFEQGMHVQYRFVKSAHCFSLAEEWVVDVFSRCRTRISNLATSQEFQKPKSFLDPDINLLQARHLWPWIGEHEQILKFAWTVCIPCLSGLTTLLDQFSDEVDSNVWIAEVCIWTPWVYMGDLVAEDVSRLAILDVDEFCEAGSWIGKLCARVGFEISTVI